MKVKIELDSLEACRTNTGRAHTEGSHYNFELLAQISGANLDACLADLNGCAKCGDDDSAIFVITNFANALLSAYEFQRDSYKR